MARVVPDPAEWPAPQARLLLGGSLKGNPEGLWARVKGGFFPPCISGWIKFSSVAKLWHWRDTDAHQTTHQDMEAFLLEQRGLIVFLCLEGNL